MNKTDEAAKAEYYSMNPQYEHSTRKKRKVKEAVRRFGHTESYWNKMHLTNLKGMLYEENKKENTTTRKRSA